MKSKIENKKMNNADFLNYSSSSLGAHLLSIPSQQPEPPKHSTPKKGGEDFGRPTFDESSILFRDEFDRKSNDSFAVEHKENKRTALLSEKDGINSFLDSEMQKRRSTSKKSSVLKESALDAMNRRLTLQTLSSGDTSTNTQLASRKMPKFETPSRPPSSVSDTDTVSSTRTCKLAFERGRDALNFYYVQIGDSLILRHRVWNIDSVQMRIKCNISDKNGTMEHPNFKILEVTAPIMEPRAQCDIIVQYTPTKVERNYAHLIVERINCECFRKTFQLIGYGGRAEVQLTENNFSQGIAKQASSSQAIVVHPDDPNHFWLEFENVGGRSAYVKLLATNRFGKSLTGQVSANPNQFVLSAFGEDRHRRKVSVRVLETFNWNDQQQQSNNDVFSLGKRINSSRPRDSNGRDSIMSSSSSVITFQHPECAFRIEAYWGEECQRQRLKCWQRKCKQPAFLKGVQFNGEFEGEQPTSLTQRQKIAATLTGTEVAEFQNSLRLTTLNVISVQPKTYIPEPDSPIDLYHNKSRLLREVEAIPEE